MGTGLPLRGRRVAVTRGKGGEDALSERLRELGAQVVAVPAIATAPPESFDELDRALGNLSAFDWVAFASATAVEAVLGRLAALGLPPPGRSVRLAAVGTATAARLRELLRAPDLVPAEARGAALAEALAAQAKGRRVLVPRAAEGRPELVDGLRAAGADVVAATAYRTVAAPPEAMAPLAALLERGEVDAVAFASPSAVKSVVAGLGDRAGMLARSVLAAIGPTTASALADVGLRAAVTPGSSTARDLADAIARHLGPRP
ncbi:MAG TPA: uroporphyrinogen-III synthase [Anaeromyxobacteraceae bacterium]|nr:uroporphyrinogen-III synthase [Anaeromyxobacteraceae bacterium]